LTVIGRFRAEGDVREPLPTGQAERLLWLLLAQHGRFVGTDTIVATLWSEAPPDRADRNVAVLVSRIRRALGRERIEGGTHGYRFVLGESCTLDVAEADRLVTTAERELADHMYSLAVTSAEQAVRILGEDLPFADVAGAPWLDELRARARNRLRRARTIHWLAAEQLGADQLVVDLTGQALADDPMDEAACRAHMRAHQRMGATSSALRAYARLRTALVEGLGSDPSRETQKTHLAVLRNQQVDRARPTASTSFPVTARGLEGRDPELRALHACWTEAVSGRGGIVVVTGEAGIGKSALVAAFSAGVQQAGGMVMSTACFEAERSLYLQPVLEALRGAVGRCPPAMLRRLSGRWLGTLLELMPDLATITGPVAYERAAPELERQKSLMALASFFARLGELVPVLLVVEDMQHAGESTVEALHFLTTHLHSARVLVVLTERTSDRPPVSSSLYDQAECLDLSPLDPTSVRRLLERSGLGYDLDRFYSWTGGSPLFVVELLAHRTPEEQRSRAPLRIPSSLHEAVAERFSRAGSGVHELLQRAAVLGTTFTLEDLVGLTGYDLEKGAQCTDRALQAGLLVTRGSTFRFANDVVQMVAYASMPEPIRVSLHRRAAQLWRHRPEAAAAHWAAAGEWHRAAEAGVLAAEAAHLSLANRDADALLTQALVNAERSDDVALAINVLLRRGQVRRDLGEHERARDDHQRALELSQDRGDDLLTARALEQLGWTALFARDALGAVELASQATHLAESAAAARNAVPSATLLLGRVRHWDGDYVGAQRAYEEVLTAEPDAATTATALAYHGALLQHTDHFDEARRVLSRATALARQAGEFRLLLQTLFFTGLARGDSGDFSGALQALDRARSLLDEHGLSYYRAGIETTASWLWRELGELGRAREHASHAVTLAHRSGGALELEQELHAQLALADCELALGRHDDAGARVEAAAAFLELSLPFKPRALMRMQEMRARWDPAEAEALLDTARRRASPKYEALALWHLKRPAEAARVAMTTGSDLLIARLGRPVVRRAALDRIAEALPPPMRASFTARAPLLIGYPQVTGQQTAV